MSLPASPPRPESVILTKKTFLQGMGLVENAELTPNEANSTCSNPQKLPNKLFKAMPFTHLPRELRLRNFSFLPSSRLETSNAEKIAVNWKRVDALCPAYPHNHSRYKSFIPPNQTFKITEPETIDYGLRRRLSRPSNYKFSDSASTSTTSATSAPPKTKAKKGRLHVLVKMLTKADIWNAGRGININAIIDKYKGHNKRDEDFDSDTDESEQPSQLQKNKTEAVSPGTQKMLCVMLERIPSNDLALSSPTKTNDQINPETNKSPSVPRESVIKFCGSPRRLLPSTSVIDSDDDSDDEVVFLGHFRRDTSNGE